MSRWLAEKASSLLAERSSRRGFLYRSALVGSALATNPVELLTRPVSAYAAVCECRNQPCACGSSCCDGYTEFCCNISGSNSCPAGTILGGWWKADGSGFCGSDPRYYMDCNVLPGNEGVCYCHCSGDDCGHRVECCSGFRYGQCHQEYAALGRIYCRVVTCTPPWVIDGACTTTSATDQATAFHDAACLHGPTDPTPIGRLEAARAIPGGIVVSGWAFDHSTVDPINVDIYAGSSYVGTLRADQSRPDVQQAYGTSNPGHGFSGSLSANGFFGTTQVCAYAINVGPSGINPPIGCIPVDLGKPAGNLDAVTLVPGGVRVSGWAVDPDTAGPVDIHVYGAGRFLGATRTGTPRSDVLAYYPGYGGNHGFDAVIPSGGLSGDVQICAYAINIGPQNVNPQIGCRAARVGWPFGNLDSVTAVPGGVRVEGWAIDPDTAGSVEVHIYAGGSLAGYGRTGTTRNDVAGLYPAFGNKHGFSFTVPMSGTQTVCAYAINDNGPINPQIGCRVASA